MKIHHIRNATLLLETGDKVILVDPMLGGKGEAAPPFSFIRFKPKRNPIVDLPANAAATLEKTTHCLITHLHADHLDKAGEQFLRSRQIPVICSVRDEKVLTEKGLHIIQAVNYWQEAELLGGKIMGIPAVHGYGYVAKKMGNVMGFYLELPDEPSVYIGSDTIYTTDVHRALMDLNPAIAVVASGSAQLDFFQPILMRMEDILKFVKNAPGMVIANHLEAVNHCPTRREQLKKEVLAVGQDGKVWIPNDGDARVFA
jgi:L-ascorbate metabolism protein UlaG (beta-lactamase superfamily)